MRADGGDDRVRSPRRLARELPPARAALLDLTPRQVLAIDDGRLPARYRRTLERFRYGPGVFKIDWALDGPIPWTNPAAARAATVHVAGTAAEIAASEPDVQRGPASPSVRSSCSCSRARSTRAARPAGKHTGWAYCHVPHGSTVDMTDAIERQVERFAPGFRDRVLARHTMGAGRDGSARRELRGRRHQRRQSPTSASSSPGRAFAPPVGDARARAVPLLVVDAARRRRARHVRMERGPARTAPRGLIPGPTTGQATTARAGCLM